MYIAPVHLEVVRENREFSIAIVPPFALAGGIWDYVVELLEKDPELWNHAHTTDSLRLMLETGQITLWFVVKNGTIYMAFFTTFQDYPVCRMMEVVWASGKDLVKYLGIGLLGLEDHAKRNGCAGVNIAAYREGWSKPLLPFGYRRTQTIFTKMLSNERLN
jgi:hypothetical protein